MININTTLTVSETYFGKEQIQPHIDLQGLGDNYGILWLEEMPQLFCLCGRGGAKIEKMFEDLVREYNRHTSARR